MPPHDRHSPGWTRFWRKAPCRMLKKLTGHAGLYSVGFPRMVPAAWTNCKRVKPVRPSPTFEIMNLTRSRKIIRPIVRNPDYRPAFAWVDAALVKNNYTEHEKTQFWLTKMFGRPPGAADNPK